MHEVAILGAGFSGIGMAARLLQSGIDDIVVLERAGDVGGTWRDNTFPGAACDIPSDLYSFSFAPNPEWTRVFPPQGEILAYLRDVADRFGVRAKIRFGTELERADWDDDARMWRLATSGGAVEARVLVSASGPFVDPTWPAIPGLEGFAGARFHSARWDHGVDLTGKRVAVIGTGASAIQLVPEVRRIAAHVDVFQRSAPWILPRLDRRTSRLRRAAFRRFPTLQRISRGFTFRAYELRWPVFANPVVGRVAGAGLSVLRRLALRDRDLAARARPHYRVGCKRILISDDWYPALRAGNVDLVTDPIERITASGVVVDGVERPADVLICATGFAVTAPQIAHRIHGRDGRSLADAWAPHASALRGTAVAGFPNLFQLLGPNTTLAHNSMIAMIEAQIGYVLQALAARSDGVIEARPAAQASYDAAIQDAMRTVVWTTGGCASYYLDAAGRNTAAWPHGAARFVRELRRFDPGEFSLS